MPRARPAAARGVWRRAPGKIPRRICLPRAGRGATSHAALKGDVQVLADQHALAAQIQARHFRDLQGLPYLAFDQASVVSSIRFENPHSLSNQEQTLPSVPSMTLVKVASEVDE